MNIVQIFKSKTVDFNIIVTAIFALLNHLGIVIPAEVMTGVLAVGNFILRFVTKKPIAEK